MNTLEEQYKIQWNETKIYWKKKRQKRAMLFAILTVIAIIFTMSMVNNEYFTLIKYPLGLAIIASAACSIRELIIPMKQETAELKHLNKLYDEERFKERNG